MEVIQLRDYGRRTGVHAQQIHDQIAKALKASGRVRLDFADVESIGATFLDRSLGALVARHGATVLRSIVFSHCSPRSRRASSRRSAKQHRSGAFLTFPGGVTLLEDSDRAQPSLCLTLLSPSIGTP